MQPISPLWSLDSFHGETTASRSKTTNVSIKSHEGSFVRSSVWCRKTKESWLVKLTTPVLCFYMKLLISILKNILRQYWPDQLCRLETLNRTVIRPHAGASLLNQCTFCNQNPYLSFPHSANKNTEIMETCKQMWI